MSEFLPDLTERNRIVSHLESMPTVNQKRAWVEQWTSNTNDAFSTRILALATAQTIFCTSAAAIFCLTRHGMMPWLYQAHHNVTRDNAMHASFNCLLYQHLDCDPDHILIARCVKEAVQLEQAFAHSERQPHWQHATTVAHWLRFRSSQTLPGRDKRHGHEGLHRARCRSPALHCRQPTTVPKGQSGAPTWTRRNILRI